MSNERDRLALDIPTWVDLPFGGGNDLVKLDANAAYAVAGVLIEKGWRKPRTVTTAEELDALPVGSVVVSDGRAHYRVCIGTVPYVGVGWESTRSRGGWRSEDIPLPATVLHEGSPE